MRSGATAAPSRMMIGVAHQQLVLFGYSKPRPIPQVAMHDRGDTPPKSSTRSHRRVRIGAALENTGALHQGRGRSRPRSTELTDSLTSLGEGADSDAAAAAVLSSKTDCSGRRMLACGPPSVYESAAHSHVRPPAKQFGLSALRQWTALRPRTAS